MPHEPLKDLYERKAHALTKRPTLARASGEATARLGPGLACAVEHAKRTMVVDLPFDDGGEGSAPHPGELMRASVSACLAMGFRIWAARMGIAVDDIVVVVRCAFDTRGQLGVDDTVPVGWQSMLIDVALVSAAPADALDRLATTVLRLSPMLANLSPAIAITRHVRVVPPPASRTEQHVPRKVTPG